jgi:hypothetical protein
MFEQPSHMVGKNEETGGLLAGPPQLWPYDGGIFAGSLQPRAANSGLAAPSYGGGTI